ncbi:MAG: DUF21 domain-containing protein [bacterium]|nr:DUF21 domain-containing protein [bacterium]
MNPWGWVLLIGLCWSSFFSGSETAVVSCDRLRQRAAGVKGKRLAKLAERLYIDQERILALLLLGNNVANIVISIAALVLTQEGLEALGVNLPAFWRDIISSIWISLLVLSEEILTKGIGHSYAVRITRASAPLLLVLYYLLFPVLWLILALANGLKRMMPGSRGQGKRAGVSWDTLGLHLETGHALGIIEKQEEEVIHRIGQMAGQTARDLMIPLAKLRTMSLTASIRELKEHLKEGADNRVFLYDDSPVNLVGVLSTNRLLGLEEQGNLKHLHTRLRCIPASRNLVDMIDEMEISRSRFLAVIDLDGNCLGVVFLRDLMRQLVLTHKPLQDPGLET